MLGIILASVIWVSNESAWRVEHDKLNDVCLNPIWRRSQNGGFISLTTLMT